MTDKLTVREQIIRDCVDLLPFADDSAKALASHDLRNLKALYSGQSQKRVIVKLARLIDDLGKCRTVDDFPGPDKDVEELRNVSLEVFRGLTEYAGNPFNLTTGFRSGAVDFFHGLLTRDPLLLARVRKRRERTLALTLLTCAITLMGMILGGLSVPANLLALTSGFIKGTGLGARKRQGRAPSEHVEDGEWMRREREDVLAWANDTRRNPAGKLPHELAIAVWRAHAADYAKAAREPASKRGYKDAKSLRAHFYPNKGLFLSQRRKGLPFCEP